MNPIFIVGHGAVSPAGWGVPPLRDALRKNEAIPTEELNRPGWGHPLHVRQVPSQTARPSFLSHARLRRASPITHYAVAAALEALGDDAAKVANGSLRLGIILCVMTGCVNYSRRFYSEVLHEPATASPILFPNKRGRWKNAVARIWRARCRSSAMRSSRNPTARGLPVIAFCNAKLICCGMRFRLISRSTYLQQPRINST